MASASPLTMLIVTANPRSTDVLRAGQEIRSIQERLGELERKGSVKIVLCMAARIGDLRQALYEFEPHIVHFIGHGTEEDLLLEEHDGRERRVDKASLARLFDQFKNHVRLVVLDACRTASHADAIARHIDCAIGMDGPVDDDAAIDFAAALYEAIRFDRSVQTAFEAGCLELGIKHRDAADLPVLCKREGVDPATLVLMSDVEQAAPEPACENILLVLDLASDNPFSPEDVYALLPNGRAHRTLLATSYGAAPAPRGAVDFLQCADPISRMVEDARAHGTPAGVAKRYYIAGRAALPMFAHLGMELSTWADRVTLLNRRPDGRWDVMALDGSAPQQGAPFFTVHKGLDGPPSDANGWVAVFLSTKYPPVKDSLVGFLRAHGAALAGIVEARTEDGKDVFLGKENASRAMSELVALFQRVRTAYPSLAGVALFIAGPAPLAFMAGRAINRHIIPAVWVPNHDRGAYRFAAELPWKGRRRPVVSDAPEARHGRDRSLSAVREAVEELRRTLRAEHLPPSLSREDTTRLLVRLGEVQIAKEPRGDVFDMSVSERTMTFGTGLLEALRRCPEIDRERIGRYVLLRELFHFDQNVQSTLRPGAGCAGIALEEVDYWADALTAHTLAQWEIARGGETAAEQAGKIVTAHVDSILSGLEAFDRSEHGDRIERLAERRLRRYLVWHLMRTRAATLRRGGDLGELFGKRLFVELAPVRGYLDENHQKIVETTIETTEILIAFQGRLIRVPRQIDLDPAALVHAVRTFDRKAMDTGLRKVRDQHIQVLAPWVR